MDKLVFVFAITAFMLQSVYCEECIDDVKVNCELMVSMFSICTVNSERAARVCPKTCNMCHPDGNWADWSSWSRCSVTCGSSQQTRTRTCTNPPPPNNGTSCEGASEENKSCLNEPCPIPVAWGPWSEWGTCSSTCDAGIQHRGRLCNRPFSKRNNETCVGDSTEERICVQRACADGGWTMWSAMSTCSATCGVGTHQRTRDCTNPSPSAYGRYCTGPNTEVFTCNTQYCPQTDGGWTRWSTWSTCSATCGVGIHQRTRDCTNPPPSAFGRYCIGPNTEVFTCNTQYCPQTDGGWSGWSSWSTCTSSCGGGVHQRHRGCTNPAPSPYGQPCIGMSVDVMACNKHKCASDHVVSAFTAAGDISGDGNPLRFPTAFLNLGNDYNPTTGVFTCRVPGLYFFSVSLQKKEKLPEPLTRCSYI